jgi:hypothetical protein
VTRAIPQRAEVRFAVTITLFAESRRTLKRFLLDHRSALGFLPLLE